MGKSSHKNKKRKASPPRENWVNLEAKVARLLEILDKSEVRVPGQASPPIDTATFSQQHTNSSIYSGSPNEANEDYSAGEESLSEGILAASPASREGPRGRSSLDKV